MKLSVCLMRDSVTSFDGVLQQKYREGDAAFEPIEPTAELPYPHRGYLQTNRAKKPKWAAYLSSNFDLNGYNLLNQNSSFVLLIQASGRIFAVTFGMSGMHALDPTKIEPRFGLIVAANCIKDEELCTVESNEVDLSTKHKQVHISKGSNVSEFELNPHLDWIKKLSGVLHNSELATTLSGADSICIGVNCALADLGNKCEEFLEVFNRTDYKQRFEIIDHLQPLHKHDPMIPKLEAMLSDRLEAGSHERLSLAFQEVPNFEQLEHFKVTGNFQSVDLAELTLAGIYQFMEVSDVLPNASSIRIIGIGNNDEPITRLRSLRDYLVGEFDADSETYIFSHGDWFRAERDYVARVRKEVSELTDLTAELGLIPIRNNESEGDYNIRAADDRGLLNMDRNNFRIGGPYDKIEICDLLSQDCQMVCVKKMDGSSALSHLFGQGSVSATLLRREPQYLAHFNKVCSDAWPGFIALDTENLGRVTVVFAVATHKDEPLSEGMFFFSLVNLLSHVKTIRMVGCNVALCKVIYEAPPAPPTPTKRKKKVLSAL